MRRAVVTGQHTPKYMCAGLDSEDQPRTAFSCGQRQGKEFRACAGQASDQLTDTLKPARVSHLLP